jgi:hypothetical protein
MMNTGDKKLSLIKGVKDFPSVEKALQDIEKALNDLTVSTNTASEGEVSDIDGKTGDIRITQNEDKDYIFEIRAEDGWKTPVIGNTAVKFKEKPSSSAAEKKESIDEIETKDTTTVDKVAEKTIFDEKADKFVIARPDFDSGWHTWVNDDRDGSDNTPLTIAHGLGVLPSMIVSYYAPDQSPGSITWFTPFSGHRGASYANGAGCYVDNTNIYMWAGEGTTLVGIPWPIDHCGRAVFYNGSVRTLLWK